MVSVSQLVFSLLGSRFPLPEHDAAQLCDVKSIVIVGAGSAGLAMLKTFLDLPESTISSWSVVLFEQRHSLGGVWLPDPNPASPPEFPETPLYPSLHTNTPVPSMSYPGFPFTKGTPLYPHHRRVEAYRARYASQYNLTNHIQFNHKVLTTLWTGNASEGYWDIVYRDASGTTRHTTFAHLVVATGNNHIPRIPAWQGQQDWLKNSPKHGPKRELLHSVWYRGPDRYAGRRVLIVGTGSSGRDVASQIVPYAKETFVSMRHDPDPVVGPIPEGAHLKPDISYFTAEGVAFRDGTDVKVDAVLLATGYEIRIPFLEDGNVLITDRQAHSNASYSEKLVTNTRYIFPLHQHIFSLSPSYPVNALAFIGLPSAIANCPSDIAQSLFATHVILNTMHLPSRKELLRDLARHEDGLRKAGYDPYSIGHRLPVNTSSDFP